MNTDPQTDVYVTMLGEFPTAVRTTLEDAQQQALEGQTMFQPSDRYEHRWDDKQRPGEIWRLMEKRVGRGNRFAWTLRSVHVLPGHPAAPVAAPPTGQKTCACGQTPDPGICPTEHDGYQAGGHCVCAHQPADRASIHRAAVEQIRAAARNLFFDAGARVLAALDVVPSTGQTGLRDHIRRAVCEAEGFAWDSDMLEPDEYGDVADMVLSVLPAPADRSAVLEEAAQIAVAENQTCPAVYQCQPCLTRERVAAALLRAAVNARRLGAETPGPETQGVEVSVAYRIQLRDNDTADWKPSHPYIDYEDREDADESAALSREYFPGREYRVVTRTTTVTEEPAVVAEPGKECAASVSSNCLAEAQSETGCATEDGECVHAGQPGKEA